MKKIALIVLAVSLAVAAAPGQRIKEIQATGTGALVTYEDGTGYYYGEETENE